LDAMPLFLLDDLLNKLCCISLRSSFSVLNFGSCQDKMTTSTILSGIDHVKWDNSRNLYITHFMVGTSVASPDSTNSNYVNQFHIMRP
jgi:hypothetical protein